MEAGYDYLLVNRRSRGMRRWLPFAGVGVVVLALVGVLIWSLFAFVFSGSEEEPIDEAIAQVQSTPAPEPSAAPATPAPTPAQPLPTTAPVQAIVARPAPTPVSELPPELVRFGILYPGGGVQAPDWADLLGARGPIVVDEGPWADAAPVPVGQRAAPTRLTIPSIGVDSEVQQLRILSLVNSSSYETPNGVVGHIPETANPGESGSVWMFGHLESPILDQGNVFAQLPEIPSLLRRNEEVFAVVQNGTESYRYRIVESLVVPQRQFELTDDGTAQLFMVTCVPRGIYDQRLVVRGVLEGVRS